MVSEDESDEPAEAEGSGAVKPVHYSAPKLNPPERFDFSEPAGWTRWSNRWRRYREASGLDTRPEKEQINTFIYTLGEQAEDILLSRGIEEKDYASVLDAFNNYFGVRRNLVAERAKFNKMTQGNDSMDVFIHKLYRQAENCEYQGLREELIRDRLVVGVTDDKLSEKLQADADLTLDDAVTIARRFESAIQAQSVVRAQNAAVDVHANRLVSRKHSQNAFRNPPTANHSNNPKTNNPRPSNPNTSVQRRPDSASNNRTPSTNSCRRCGKAPSHAREACPASKSSCSLCGKKGHWRAVCFSGPQVTEVEIFTGEVNNHTLDKPWTAMLDVVINGNSSKTKFKLDSGAAATVCSPNCITSPLQPNINKLRGPGNILIPCIGQVDALLYYGDKYVSETVYVVEGQQVNLLSKNACQHLDLLTCNVNDVYSLDNVVDSTNVVGSDNIVNFDNVCNSQIFTGLGTVKSECEIKLFDDAKPYSIFVPRSVPIPLLEKTKLELERMKELGVIAEAKQPTEWCAPMVVVPKKDTVRICTDFTQLNKYVKREVFPMATVEDSLSKLNGGRIFSKLDANSGFWQIPMSESSQHLTTFLTPFGRFYYKKLPFGLSSAPEIFCREMTKILEGIAGVVVHMDDILVIGSDEREHNSRLTQVLRRIQDAGLTLNRSKCAFKQTSVEYLGHRIDSEGIHAGERISALLDFPTPTCAEIYEAF